MSKKIQTEDSTPITPEIPETNEIMDCPCPTCTCDEPQKEPTTEALYFRRYKNLLARSNVIFNELRAVEHRARTIPLGKYRPNVAEMARESADIIHELMSYIIMHGNKVV